MAMVFPEQYMLHPSVPYRRGATSGGSWSSRSNIGYTLRFPIAAGRCLEVLGDYISVGCFGGAVGSGYAAIAAQSLFLEMSCAACVDAPIRPV